MPSSSLRLPGRRPLVPLVALVAAGAIALTAGVSSASAATIDGGVAWTVQTADNDHGSARGNFTYDAEPGAVIEDAMIVANTGTTSLPLAVYAADAFTASSGDIDVLLDGTPSVDSGTWVSISTGNLELAPGERAVVDFTITVPADARPGDHSAGLVTSFASQDASQSLSVDRRLGTRINIRVAGELVPAATVTHATASYSPEWNPFVPGTLTIEYALENSGNTRITGRDAVTASALAGVFDTTTPAEQLSEVIPGSTIEVRREIPVLSLGWLTGSVTVSPEGVGLGAGSVDPVVADFAIPAVPYSLYAVLLLLALLVVGIVLFVRHRARRAGIDVSGSSRETLTSI